MKKNSTILIVAVIVALGAGFFGGMQYQKMSGAKVAANTPGQGFNRGNFTGATAGQRNRNGAGFTAGSILSKNDKSVTVKLQNGGSEIVFLAPSSEIMKSATGTIADLVVGENVVVSGTANPDGSITAKTIQLGTGRPGGFGPGGQVQNRPSSTQPNSGQ